MRATPSWELSPRCFGYAGGRGERIAEGLLSPALGSRKIDKPRCPGLPTEALFLLDSPLFTPKRHYGRQSVPFPLDILQEGTYSPLVGYLGERTLSYTGPQKRQRILLCRGLRPPADAHRAPLQFMSLGIAVAPAGKGR